MKHVRIISASVFLISIVLWGFALIGDGPFAYDMTSLLLWGSLGTFCFTEGFMFSPPQRTKFNIYGARFFFVAACIVVAQIMYALLSGQIK